MYEDEEIIVTGIALIPAKAWKLAQFDATVTDKMRLKAKLLGLTWEYEWNGRTYVKCSQKKKIL